MLFLLYGLMSILTYAYEGGEAFMHLHQVFESEREMHRSVHVDVPAAMTGVSRFGEEFSAWGYVLQHASIRNTNAGI